MMSKVSFTSNVKESKMLPLLKNFTANSCNIGRITCCHTHEIYFLKDAWLATLPKMACHLCLSGVLSKLEQLHSLTDCILIDCLQ